MSRDSEPAFAHWRDMELVNLCAEGDDCGSYAWDHCDEDDDACIKALAATECHFDMDDRTACLQSLAVCNVEPVGEGGDCNTTVECDEGLFCSADMTCQPLLESGEPCLNDEQCASGSCVDPPGPPPPECE